MGLELTIHCVLGYQGGKAKSLKGKYSHIPCKTEGCCIFVVAGQCHVTLYMYMYMYLSKATWPCLGHASVAQLVQHLPRTQNIAGSSPARGRSSFSLEKRSCLRVSLLAFALSL